jgi:uncharacterized protein
LSDDRDEGIDYQRLIDEALLDVVRRLLARVAERGLPGEHHFHINFRTTHPGVIVPRSLRDLYPEEMHVVLQHQFWNLEVEPDHFSVELSFGAHRQRLVIPFAALTRFLDPAAEFGLSFEARPGREPDGTEPRPTRPPGGGKRPGGDGGGRKSGSGEVIRFDPMRRK